MARGDNMGKLCKGFGQGLSDKDSVLTSKDEKMDAKEAFKTLFGFNLADFNDVFDNSCIGNLCGTLEEARKVKKAYERLNEDFGWNENLYICKNEDDLYSVEVFNQFNLNNDIEIIE